jgi:hypothetical protein
MEKKVYLFDVYDNGELVGTGTAPEMADKVGIHRNTFYRYAKEGRLLGGRWLIRYSGTAMVKVKGKGKLPPKPLPPKPKTKLEQIKEYMTINLKKYGNAYTTEKPEIFGELLRDTGISYTYRVSSLPSLGKKKGFDIGYVLEVINEATGKRAGI